MKLSMTTSWLLISLLFITAWFTHPIITGEQDAPLYLDLMNGFMEHGLRWDSYREPLYPLSLAFFTQLGIAVTRHIALIQNLAFVSSLVYFLRSALSSITRMEAWGTAALITLIPTFCITMNGALYTEAFSAALILIYLGSVIRTLRALEMSRYSTAAVGGLLALIAGILLGFNKGSLVMIHLFFPVLAGLILWRRISRRVLLILVVGLIFSGLMSRAAESLWLGARPGQPVFSKRVYMRGGPLFYGRSNYAKNFNFKQQSIPYLLQALSESGCYKLIGEECHQYGFLAEGDSGWMLYGPGIAGKHTDEELMAMGTQMIIQSPLRQALFCFYEWARFIFHHGTNGFGRFTLPVGESVIHSWPMSALLKLFNLALYLLIPFTLRKGWRGLNREEKNATLLYVAYSASFLAVHGFVPTLVRMVFPIAPFLVILNITLLRSFWGPQPHAVESSPR